MRPRNNLEEFIVRQRNESPGSMYAEITQPLQSDERIGKFTSPGRDSITDKCTTGIYILCFERVKYVFLCTYSYGTPISSAAHPHDARRHATPRHKT